MSGLLYSISISGPNETRLVRDMTRTLSHYQANILDISEAVIHDWLSMALIIELKAASYPDELFESLLHTAKKHSLHMQFSQISLEHYENWVQAQEGSRSIITLLSRQVSAQHVHQVAELVAEHGLDIVSIQRLSALDSFTGTFHPSMACIEFVLHGHPLDMHMVRNAIIHLSHQDGIDLAWQEESPFRRQRRLIAFDMDSTLIQTEIIDELALEAGVGQEVADITSKTMHGELDFQTSLVERVALLKGLHAEVLDKVARRMPLAEGAGRLISSLKRLGYTVAVISGGFTYFGSYLQQRLGLDYVFANELEIDEGVLTGRLKGEIVDGPKKAELLQRLADSKGLSMDQVVAVGDGANDLPMLNTAGLGIAFHAKPLVRQGAKQSISNVGLDGILYFLGLRDQEALRG
ncbi:MAG: phosphoserine phosphatase SerB [Desulfovermiculus sp.]